MMKNKVTSNVMYNISNRIKAQDFSNGKGKALIVINGSSMDILNDLGFIQNLKFNGFEISVGFSFMAERLLDTKRIIDLIKPSRIYSEEDIGKLKDIINQYELVVGPNITMNTLSKISLGMIDSLIPNIIWSFLYHGKKVYLNFNIVRNQMGERPKSKEISNIIEEHINKIIKMGAIEISGRISIPNIISKENILKDDISNISETSNEIVKKLVSERDITKLGENQKVLVLNKGTIVTPLARDKAKELGISIEIK